MANITSLKDALNYYNTKDKAWTKSEINSALEAFGSVLRIKERVDSYDELPTENVSAGDVYTVGAEDADEFEEWYWNGTRWEYMGTTGVDLSGYISTKQLYAGNDNTGTIAAPASGTILKTIYDKIDAKADKLLTGVENQILVDDGNGNLKGSGKTIAALTAEIVGNAETDTKDSNTIAGAKKYTDNAVAITEAEIDAMFA